MTTESRRAKGKMVLAVIAVLFFCSSVPTDAQKLYAMQMNAWARTAGPVYVVQASDLQGWGALLQKEPHVAPLARTPHATEPPTRESPATPTPVTICAGGLVAPDGLALRPETGVIYISEEDPSRILAIVGGHKTIVADTATLIRTLVHGQPSPAQPLAMPEGIAFSAQGDLYVVEDYPGGRLIRFTLNKKGIAIEGTVVDIPGVWKDFAWESVSVSSAGEILMAGSTLEKVAGGDCLDGFVGVILFRDSSGLWWMLLRVPFESFSAVAFSSNGLAAAFACEVTGDIGWIDLRSRTLRQGHSEWQAKAPEGLDILPDGRFLVAEEAGSVIVFDPASGSRQLLCRTGGSIESVLHDSLQNRVLITADGTGRLLAIALPPSAGKGARHALDEARYESAHTPVHIPSTMPGFLTNSLVRYGGLPPDTKDTPMTFRRFAEHVPIIALNATVVPMDAATTEADPICIVQFLVLHPTDITVTDAGVDMPVAAFAIVTASGKIIRTTFTNMNSAGMSCLGLIQGNLGNVKVGLPYPFTAHVSPDGICNIHFSGLMTTPDYHFVLNPTHPSESYMVVDRNDGKLWQYKLLPPNGETRSEHMVISYQRHAEQDWVQLGRSNADPDDRPIRQVSG